MLLLLLLSVFLLLVNDRYNLQAVESNRYDDDPILSSCGIKIEKQLTRVDGRVLTAPTVRPNLFLHFAFFIYDSVFSNCSDMLIQLVVGNSEDCIPNKGRWNYNNKVATLLLVTQHAFSKSILC